ncbi:MAG: glutamine-hydrolyzing GMP synthase [Flavobacteriales bacterium]
MENMVLILDLGSQYTQLIARRIRELNVYCEIYPYNKIPAIDSSIKGVILSGSPFSVHDESAPTPDITNIKGKLPLLGICYGAQLLATISKGKVERSSKREYGRSFLSDFNRDHELLKGLADNTQVWMSHGDSISETGNDIKVIASTRDFHIAAFDIKNESSYGIQFHPEVYHTTEGKLILENFIVNICGCERSWTPASFIEEKIDQLNNEIAENEHVVLGLSGGVDSTVAAMLLHRAVGKRLHCIFVDNGLLRKSEFEEVLESYKNLGLNVKGVDAKDEFYNALKNISDPEEKRKAIGGVFIKVFDREANNIRNELSENEFVKWLGQGTIYPDMIESVSVKGPSAKIKSHHNVGGLPDKMDLKVIEPLNSLFKDKVRRVGKELNIPDLILSRHPFPGPGLAIRILGEITREKVRILQEADSIFIKNLQDFNVYNEVWQAGAIFLPVHSVGVMGDERTYENVVALRAVTSTDGMTADRCELSYELLGKVADEIINNIQGINRVVYDVSSKPPATIEWE